ncbi:MAG: GntR family transcriptional regulator [Lautropia sp.]
MTKLDTICAAISRRIDDGTLSDGDRLPSESRFAADFGVSVGTVQKALQRLSSKGLIRREQGRGTFVSFARITPDVEYLRFQDADGRVLANVTQVRSVRRMKRAGAAARFLGPHASYVRIEREMRVGGRFDLLSEFWLLHEDFERLTGFDGGDLAANLRVQIMRSLALPTLQVDQRIRFQHVSAPMSRRLGLAPGCPAFVMEMRGCDAHARPLFFQRIYSAPFDDDLLIIR